MNALPALAAFANALPAIAVDVELAQDFARSEKAPATRRAYRSDFWAFSTWCQARGLAALPAAPETVAAFLAASAAAGLRPSTIGRRVAAIRYAHKLAGHDDPPTNSETVKATVRGIRRTLGAAPASLARSSAPSWSRSTSRTWSFATAACGSASAAARPTRRLQDDGRVAAQVDGHPAGLCPRRRPVSRSCRRWFAVIIISERKNGRLARPFFGGRVARPLQVLF